MKKQLVSLLCAAVIIALVLTGTGCQKEDGFPGAEFPVSVINEGSTATLSDTLKVCVDKDPADLGAVDLRTSVIDQKVWTVGQVLRVRFLDGADFVRGKVIQMAREWEQYANIRFQFIQAGQAEIRISFAQEGSWSYIGRDALFIPADQPTMNFGWFDERTTDTEFRRTTLHEFGHALGCIHEHQHPDQGIRWDTARVYAYYARQSWDRAQVDQNIFKKYSRSQTRSGRYDPLSVMHYPVPNELTLDDFEIGWNVSLSEEDKAFMSKLYPSESPRNEPLQNQDWMIASNGAGAWQPLNATGGKLSEALFGDFDGDGRFDALRGDSISRRWLLSKSGSGAWQAANSYLAPLNGLRVGDFDGDGRADIFRADSLTGKWSVSYGAAGPWKALNTLAAKPGELRFGDFDGDGRTDVFRANPVSRLWEVSWGGATAWQRLNQSNIPVNYLGFGDFDGDGRTDVFYVHNTGHWFVNPGGSGGWLQMIRTNATSLQELVLADFDGDGRTDVFRAGPAGRWEISRGGLSAWQTLRENEEAGLKLVFGDFNGDGKTDVVRGK